MSKPIKKWDCKDYLLPYRERQIILLLMQGYTRQAIALKLGIAYQTVRNKITLMMIKYDAVNANNLIFRLLDRGLIFIDDVFR